MISKQVPTHQRNERGVATRQQPHALVVERRVVRRGTEPMMDVETALREVRGVQRHRQNDQHLGHRSVTQPLVRRATTRIDRSPIRA